MNAPAVSAVGNAVRVRKYFCETRYKWGELRHLHREKHVKPTAAEQTGNLSFQLIRNRRYWSRQHFRLLTGEIPRYARSTAFFDTGHHSAELLHVPGGNFMTRMRRQSGIEHALTGVSSVSPFATAIDAKSLKICCS